MMILGRHITFYLISNADHLKLSIGDTHDVREVEKVSPIAQVRCTADIQRRRDLPQPKKALKILMRAWETIVVKCRTL